MIQTGYVLIADIDGKQEFLHVDVRLMRGEHSVFVSVADTIDAATVFYESDFTTGTAEIKGINHVLNNYQGVVKAKVVQQIKVTILQ